MQQLGTSGPSGEAGGSDAFFSLGFDGNSTASSAPLVFDESTDTRNGNPRKRRGNGSHLGDSSAPSRSQARQQTAGMIRNDEEVARRQQIIEGVASEPAPIRPAPASQSPSSTPRIGISGPIRGISLKSSESGNDADSLLKNNPLTDRIRQMRGTRIVNPITFVQENGGGLETFGVWLYEYRHLFILLTIIFLAVGILFNRYISFAAGIVMILVGMWLDRIDDDNDTILVYLCGTVAALVPFIL